MIKPNVNWEHGYKFLFYRQDKDICLGIRNGKEMTSFFYEF